MDKKLNKNLKRNKGQIIKKEFSAWLLLVPTVIVMYLMIWRPTALGFVWSFFKMKGFRITEFCGLENYIEVLTDTNFPIILFNTVKYVFWSLVIGFIPPFILALFINEMVYFKNGFKVTIYLPSIMPGVVALLMWYYIYYPDQSGLLNLTLSKLGIQPSEWLLNAKLTIPLIVIAMTWQGAPGSMLLYFSALQSQSPELYEAAVIDGAGIFSRLRYVTLPQMGGIFLINLVNQIINVFQVVQEPMTMTGGGPKNASMTLGYLLYNNGFKNGRAGQAMAIGSIMFIILFALTIFYFHLNKKVEENYS